MNEDELESIDEELDKEVEEELKELNEQDEAF